MRYRNGPGGLPGQIGRLTAAEYNPQKMSRSTLGPIFRDLPGSGGGAPEIPGAEGHRDPPQQEDQYHSRPGGAEERGREELRRQQGKCGDGRCRPAFGGAEPCAWRSWFRLFVRHELQNVSRLAVQLAADRFER